MWTYVLAFSAGVLSTLSPCVLPLLPIIISTALTAHRYGVIAIASGMAISFSIMGIVLVTFGLTIGLDVDKIRFFAAALMIVIAVFLLSQTLQARFVTASSGVSRLGHLMLSKVTMKGVGGQFIIGILLGLVWAPCIGPTLGAAIVLAGQGKELGTAFMVMLIFALGASFPIIVLGHLSQRLMLRTKSQLQVAGVVGKKILGIFLLVIGVLILSKQDKVMETFFLTHAPDWLVHFTTML